MNANTETWAPIEGPPAEIAARSAGCFSALAEGSVSAVIVRGAFAPDQCRPVVRGL